MAGPLDPITDLIRTLRNAIASMGGEEQETRLLAMADACLGFQSALKQADPKLSPVPKSLDGWEGADADVFRDKWANHLDQRFRAAAVDNLGAAAEVLKQSVEATRKTRKALNDLIESLLISMAAGAAVSLASAGLSTYAAWASTATRGATLANGILSKFAAFRSAATALMRTLEVVGKSRLVRGLSMYGSQGFKQVALNTLRKYGQIYGWSFGGNMLAGGVARGVFGQNPFDVSILSLAQTANASTVAGLTGPLGATNFFTQLAKTRPLLTNVTNGAIAGGVPAFWNARIEGKSWGQTWSDVALFSGIAGGFNGAVGRAFNPAAGQRGLPSPQWFKSLPPMAQSSLLGFAPSVGLRVAVPFAPSAPPLRVSDPPELPGG
ncbi:hypothetical protein [Nonomuraea rhizosphaerae]|uniref:hypothetical protein n=1 Tax=Nonomuraea rhizosphaerae TaxID=2665663 RepID=UPI001C5EF3DB|nr:hypothetical protein [Nonomuraea rhizosphaerae]